MMSSYFGNMAAGTWSTASHQDQFYVQNAKYSVGYSDSHYGQYHAANSTTPSPPFTMRYPAAYPSTVGVSFHCTNMAKGGDTSSASSPSSTSPSAYEHESITTANTHHMYGFHPMRFGDLNAHHQVKSLAIHAVNHPHQADQQQ